MKLLSGLKKTIKDYPIIAFVIAAILFAVICVPHFLSQYNLINLCLQVCDLLVIACGFTFVQLNASLDFSCTSVLASSSVIGADVPRPAERWAASMEWPAHARHTPGARNAPLPMWTGEVSRMTQL